VIEESSIILYCNSTAVPSVANYDWYLNDQLITTKTRNSDTLSLNNLRKEHSGNYSCKCTNRHGSTKSYFQLDVICKYINNNKDHTFVLGIE
jgi:hypothetical protein